MKFMIMMITDEQAEQALAPRELDAIVTRHMAVSRALREAGNLVSSGRLRFGRDASTVRLQDGRQVVHDGPFAESKEVLGGFYLIEADSKEEAITWARKLPLRDVGAIEVRPARTGAQWRGQIRGAHQYMVMFISNADKPPARRDVFKAIDAHYEVSLELAAQGKFVGSRSLEPSAAAVTLRSHRGKPVVHDGPFAEAKEFVAGYFVIACDGKDEAIEWAKQLMFGDDVCEVRPLWEG